jgi:hypothetical protein
MTMKIKLHNGKPASEKATLALEVALGCRLSDSFRVFLGVYDGAEPETNTFKISDNNDSGVNKFIPAAEILGARAHIENIPTRAYPVAWAECGNYVLIDEDRNGAVFFWDHELPDEPTELAANFGAFLDLLTPFDIRTIQLKKGQVKKAWVDPEFLKRLKK